MTNYQFEICANSVESCIAAQEGGANRVELCAGIPEGGTTPSIGTIKMARKLLSIRLHVIIRPRGGDFLYNEQEIACMEEDIRAAIDAGADGLVFGCLDADGNVDRMVMKRLMEASGNTPVTFHRAFDVAANPSEALEEIIALGCTRILTSGQCATAEEGINNLARLQQQAGGRIILLAGCGVNEKNIAHIAATTGIQEFHFSAREQVESGMKYRNPAVSMGGTVCINEYRRDVSTPRRVRDTIQALTSRE